MNFDDDKAWEARLDRALKDLPQLAAPGGLVEKTMASLERQKQPSQSRQSWPMWPLWLRTLSLATMLAFVGGLCAVNWEFAHTLLGSQWVHRVSEHFSAFGVVFATLDTLGRAAITVVLRMNGWLAL